MTDYCFCLECDTTVDTDHFGDDGVCEFRDLRAVLNEAANNISA